MWKKKSTKNGKDPYRPGYSEEMVDALIRCDLPLDRPVRLETLILAIEKRVTNLE